MLVRKRRMVVVRMVRWMWIVVCGFAGTGIESWGGWTVGEISFSVVLEAMVEELLLLLLLLCCANGDDAVCGRTPDGLWFCRGRTGI